MKWVDLIACICDLIVECDVVVNKMLEVDNN